MNIAYSGISGRIGYFINQYRSASSCVLDRSVFNWQDFNTYTSLNSYDRVFLSFPVNKINILDLLPDFLSTVRPDQTIIKFGSLGPQRVIHDVVDTELRRCCRVISLQLAPTMQSVIDEQIADNIINDYRYARPAPYVAAEDAAALAVRATEESVTKDVLSVTGSENLTVNELHQLFKRYKNYQIQSLAPDLFVDQYQHYSKCIQQQIANAYNQYQTWNPVPSTDLKDNNILPMKFCTWLENHYDNQATISSTL